MMWLDEKNYDEIAEVTGLTKNNVATRLHRIKQKIKNQSSANK
jgi:RNA polymerase sigma-70 factor (ECF subfamily)